eukprot:52985_1
MSQQLKDVLTSCKLEQHFDYLTTKGFGSWDALQLLDASDFEQLQAIPYGHFKLLLQTIQKHSKNHDTSGYQAAQKQKKIRPKYKQFLKSLNKIPKPDNIFDNVDKQIARYHELKQQYLTNWTIHQQYHAQISSYLSTTTGSNAPIQPEQVKQFLNTMQKLNGSLQHLLQEMGNTNYDLGGDPALEDAKIDTDNVIKPSNAKHSKKRSNSAKKKKKQATPAQWMVDEESSLIQDVQLYAKINCMKIKDMNHEDWKTIAAQHNDNFWRNTQFKGRSYKDCKARYKKAPITGIDTAGGPGMKGEVDEPSVSDDDTIAMAAPGAAPIKKNDDSSSSEEDDLGLLSMMQAPPN